MINPYIVYGQFILVMDAFKQSTSGTLHTRCGNACTNQVQLFRNFTCPLTSTHTTIPWSHMINHKCLHSVLCSDSSSNWDSGNGVFQVLNADPSHLMTVASRPSELCVIDSWRACEYQVWTEHNLHTICTTGASQIHQSFHLHTSSFKKWQHLYWANYTYRLHWQSPNTHSNVLSIPQPLQKPP